MNSSRQEKKVLLFYDHMCKCICCSVYSRWICVSKKKLHIYTQLMKNVKEKSDNVKCICVKKKKKK